MNPVRTTRPHRTRMVVGGLVSIAAMVAAMISPTGPAVSAPAHTANATAQTANAKTAGTKTGTKTLGRKTAVSPASANPGLVRAAQAPNAPHTVTYDGYSFKVDGHRTYLWSGEFHYFRLPSPDLWLDIFQKMHAAGFNAVSLYFDWDYHSPAPGKYDFTGVRNLDRLLDMAQQSGLYVIARPAPYINAEVDSGGLPGWLTTKAEQNRSDDPRFLGYADQWLTRIDRILKRHQLTNGTGSVIAYQVENEYYNGSAAGRAYMAHLEHKARADGITVPLTGNNNGTFNAGVGALNVDGPDSYPQGFDCSHPTQWSGVPDLSYDHPSGKPLYTPEFQGGAFDPWGGPGYDKCAQLINDQFANVFYKQNIAVGATAQSFYMTYGGTNWGWLGQPENYTSYDYGAAIRETRQLDPKYYEDKLIGYFTQSVAPLTKTDRINTDPPDNPDVIDTARMNPRHQDPVPRAAPQRLDIDRPGHHAHRHRLQRHDRGQHDLHLRRHGPGAAIHRHLVTRGQPELHQRRLQEHRVLLQHRRRFGLGRLLRHRRALDRLEDQQPRQRRRLPRRDRSGHGGRLG